MTYDPYNMNRVDSIDSADEDPSSTRRRVDSDDSMDDDDRFEDQFSVDLPGFDDDYLEAHSRIHRKLMEREKQRRVRNMKYVLLVAFTILLTLLIFVRVIITKNDKIGSSHMKDDDVVVPSPSTNLTIICGIANINTKEGLSECDEACAPATCCMEKGHGNCFDITNKDNCLLYQVCTNLVNTDVSPVTILTIVAPSTLPSLCSPQNTRTSNGRIVCDDICESATCCKSNEGNCFPRNKEICIGYSACWGGDPNTVVSTNDAAELPSRTDNIENFAFVDHLVEETCALGKLNSPSGKQACEELCSSRKCCFAEEGRDSNCFENYSQWCGEFSPCLNLNNNNL